MAYEILVIEDAKVLHQVYRLSLSRVLGEHFTLHSALNGKEGLERLNENPDIQLILLDLNMPVMGGMDFLRIIRGNDRYDKIPVIVISTEGQREQTQKALDAGAQSILIKPIQAMDLQRAAKEFLLGEST